MNVPAPTRQDHHDEDRSRCAGRRCAASTARRAARAPARTASPTMPWPRATARRRAAGSPSPAPCRHSARRDDHERQAGGDRAGRRPAQRHARARRDEAAPGRAPTALTTPKLVGRRCVLTRSSDLPPPCSSTSARTSSHAQRPTRTLTSRSSDQPSSISIVRTARERRSQSVSSRQHAIGRRPRLAPEAILGDAAGQQQQRAPRFARATGADRGSSARAHRRQRHFRRRQHAADLSADARERLEEMQIRDRRAVPELVAAAASRRPTAARRRRSCDRDRDADEPGAEQQRRGPPVARRSRRRTTPAIVSDERQDLPADRVRQERERMDVGAVDRRKRRRAPDAGVDAFGPRAIARTAAGCRCARATACGRRGISPDGAPSASVSPSP